jgi:hypothetical protein
MTPDDRQDEDEAIGRAAMRALREADRHATPPFESFRRPAARRAASRSRWAVLSAVAASLAAAASVALVLTQRPEMAPPRAASGPAGAGAPAAAAAGRAPVEAVAVSGPVSTLSAQTDFALDFLLRPDGELAQTRFLSFDVDPTIKGNLR